MRKLKTLQTYFSRCLYCNNLNEYIARDKNVNSNITDENMYSLASTYLGKVEAQWCESCDKQTAQQRVAYGLEQL